MAEIRNEWFDVVDGDGEHALFVEIDDLAKEDIEMFIWRTRYGVMTDVDLEGRGDDAEMGQRSAISLAIGKRRGIFVKGIGESADKNAGVDHACRCHHLFGEVASEGI